MVEPNRSGGTAPDGAPHAEVASSELLANFTLDRILNQDAQSRTASLLGWLDVDRSKRAILNLERTAFSQDFFEGLSAPGSRRHDDGVFARLTSLGHNDIYTWLLAWSAPNAGADVKMTLIHPATDALVQKYTAQRKIIIRESPSLYRDVVEPWIHSQDASRIQWVYNILDKKKESERILYEDPDPQTGFIILPDLKWDQATLSSLYLIAIVHDRSLRSLRDLRPLPRPRPTRSTEVVEEDDDGARAAKAEAGADAEADAEVGRRHVRLLEKIRDAADDVASRRFGLQTLLGRCGGDDEKHERRGSSSEVSVGDEERVAGTLRCFLHYHPTYYHLHVHLLSPDFAGQAGAAVGQAHLLDDVIDLLRAGVDFRSQRTLTYALGERHELVEVLRSGRRRRDAAAAVAPAAAAAAAAAPARGDDVVDRDDGR